MYLKESFLRKRVESLNIDNKMFSSSMEFGWGNGYVGLPKWHAWYGKHYDDIPVGVHGGLTFSDLYEEEDLWVIGFDTNHYMDNIQNCSFEYVKKETESLMKQCMEAEGMDIIIRIIKLNKIRNLLKK